MEDEVDLGTLQFSGFPATGKRQTFRDASGQRSRTLETWFSATLGLTVHMESLNARGDTISSDLAELHLGSPVPPSAKTAPAAASAIPLLKLYQSLFTLIAHMERDRLANDPTRHVNMDEIEEHLQKKINLSVSQWQTLVNESVKVEAYTRHVSQQGRNFADQIRAAGQQSPVSTSTLAADRATLHNMQVDLDAYVQREIDQLNTIVGPDAATRIQAYLHGPLVASMSVTQLSPAQVQALRTHIGDGR